MGIHANERANERYNIELSRDDVRNILDQIKQKTAVYVGKGNTKYSLIYYARVHKVPIKVVVSNPEIVLITTLPFDTDEYNSLREKDTAKKINRALAYLGDKGYNITKQVDEIIVNKDIIIEENLMKDYTKNKSVKCENCGGKAYEVNKPFGQYCCSNCQTFTSHRGLIQAEMIECPNCEVQYEAIPQHVNINCQDCGCNYNQYSRTIKTDKWVGDFIERCKGG